MVKRIERQVLTDGNWRNLESHRSHAHLETDTENERVDAARIVLVSGDGRSGREERHELPTDIVINTQSGKYGPEDAGIKLTTASGMEQRELAEFIATTLPADPEGDRDGAAIQRIEDHAAQSARTAADLIRNPEAADETTLETVVRRHILPLLDTTGTTTIRIEGRHDQGEHSGAAAKIAPGKTTHVRKEQQSRR